MYVCSTAHYSTYLYIYTYIKSIFCICIHILKATFSCLEILLNMSTYIFIYYLQVRYLHIYCLRSIHAELDLLLFSTIQINHPIYNCPKELYLLLYIAIILLYIAIYIIIYSYYIIIYSYIYYSYYYSSILARLCVLLK
jgi:hypothetical protein